MRIRDLRVGQHVILKYPSRYKSPFPVFRVLHVGVGRDVVDEIGRRDRVEIVPLRADNSPSDLYGPVLVASREIEAVVEGTELPCRSGPEAVRLAQHEQACVLAASLLDRMRVESKRVTRYGSEPAGMGHRALEIEKESLLRLAHSLDLIPEPPGGNLKHIDIADVIERSRPAAEIERGLHIFSPAGKNLEIAMVVREGDGMREMLRGFPFSEAFRGRRFTPKYLIPLEAAATAPSGALQYWAALLALGCMFREMAPEAAKTSFTGVLTIHPTRFVELIKHLT